MKLFQIFVIIDGEKNYIQILVRTIFKFVRHCEPKLQAGVDRQFTFDCGPDGLKAEYGFFALS